MNRTFGSNSRGGSFSNQEIIAVWNKATVVPGIDPNQKRKDICGAWIELTAYGTTAENSFGWEIDHIMPVSRGGSDSLINLQPLQWQNNRQKGDSYPASGYCKISASR